LIKRAQIIAGLDGIHASFVDIGIFF